MRKILACAFVGFLVLGCDEPFSPKAPYVERLVVYCVLSDQPKELYARVYTTYNPPEFDPFAVTTDTPVKGALVEIAARNNVVRFRDTVLNRLNSERYSLDLHAYVASQVAMKRGEGYVLNVRTLDGRSVSATTQIPSSGIISVYNPFVLHDPGRYQENIHINVMLSPEARGFLVRLFIEYEIATNGKRERAVKEVPQTIQLRQAPYTPVLNFPILSRRKTEGTTKSATWELITFANSAYQYAMNQIVTEHVSRELRLLRAMIVLTQADPHFYNYYNIANGFQDPHSIRADQPDYTNIRGGLGVFGSMTNDTAYVNLLRRFH